VIPRASARQAALRGKLGAVPIKTRRWNDPAEPDDGLRVLVCRYRPRGVRKEAEPWDAWMEDLGPSRALHGAYWGKRGAPIGWDEYRRRYLAEMMQPSGRGAAMLGALAVRLAAGETITLLCSSACADPARCHRTLLGDLIGRAAAHARRSGPDENARRHATTTAPTTGRRPSR
jgi:uncharacterized protein YeaO (DUF488 family)